MSEEGFPEEVTKDNVKSLVEKAEKIQKKYFQLRFLLFIAIFYGIPTLLLGFGSIFFMSWLGLNQYLDFLLWFPSELQVPMFFVLFICVVAVWFLILASLLLSTLWLMRKYLGFPEYEEMIFAECFIIAKHLMNKQRLKAKKEVGFFLATLTGFVRNLGFNPKRKVYAQEFDLLRSGKNEICRMLMFSKDNISDLLMKFGLAFVRNDDPEAFSILQQLVDKVREYGEPKWRFRRFLSGIEQYPHASPLILTIITVVIAIIYFFVSGQRLPIG